VRVHRSCSVVRRLRAVSLRTGLHAWIDRARLPPGRLQIVRGMVPFVAVAVADVLNLGIIRRDEYLEGIAVYDEQNTEESVGNSRRAGLRAVCHCIAGRVSAAAPILIMPPLIMSRLQQRNAWLQRRPFLGLPIFMGLIGLHIHIAVPLMLGISRQTARARGNDLEAEFHKYKYVLYNKGI